MQKLTLLLIAFFTITSLLSQVTGSGILTGSVIDGENKPVEGATVSLIPFNDSLDSRSAMTIKNGLFGFNNIPFGYFRLEISFVGKQTLTYDSIWFRTERFDFNMDDIVLPNADPEQLQAVIVYAEKPLIESKDGNITFNAGESALAAGSNASELLNTVPLVVKDPDGKITIRGKEPKILIDDKPVELNLEQLQDLLESLPGSAIEKIEVMTNPPPEYANEPGGVINIITKKNKTGVSGRVSVTAGTRGDLSYYGSLRYRKKGLSMRISAGSGHSNYTGEGYSIRNNIYEDSSNFFNSVYSNTNKGFRPNFRISIDYDFNKHHMIDFSLRYNENHYDNTSLTEYSNINRFDEVWQLSNRNAFNNGDNISPDMNLRYTWKGKPGETFRIIAGANLSTSKNKREFYQVFLNPDGSPIGEDSIQQQVNDNLVNGHYIRMSYDKMLDNNKTFISLGSVYNRSNNHIKADAANIKLPGGIIEQLEALSNDFWFHQGVSNFRASAKQILPGDFSFTAGTSLEKTDIRFDLIKEDKLVKNEYWTFLPFANINKRWKDKFSLTLSYRRTIRRPGINELNPTIDFSDPYNIRFGNEKLEASTTHNFDFVAGITDPKYFLNFGVGYNLVQDIFSRVQTLLPDGKTQLTWENISDRKEFEISSWNGITISKSFHLNINATYVYSQYSEYDKLVRKFRDRGSFSSNLGANYRIQDIWNFNAGFNLNRFGSPQGYARWNTSMHFGVRGRFMNRKLSVSLNVIDPFVNQKQRFFTYGANFNLESYRLTTTRRFRISLAYNITQKKLNIFNQKK